MSKAVEKRMWPFEHPLRQTGLSQDILYNLQRWADDLSVAELVSQSAADLGRLIHMNEYNGNLLLKAAKQFPTAAITYTLRPLGADLLQIPVMIHRAFDWSSKVHGSTEPFWIWVEDHEGKNILQLYHMAFHSTTEFLHVDFLIPIRNEVPPSVLIRFVSDIWLGAEDEIAVSLDSLNMPQPSHSHTPLLDLPLLSLSALHHAFIEQTYSSFLHIFNGIQTQAFWTLYNSSRNTLLSAPAACGKSIVGYTAIW
jgi:antiviral helicase SLH1